MGDGVQAREQTEPRADRPAMPAGYGILAPEAGSGLLPWSWVSERMAAARNYWVATVRSEGRPHAAPVWGIWLDETFYFSTDPQSRKGRNFAANPHITVHLESGDEAVILDGVVEPATDPVLLARFADAYDAKYHFRPDVNAGSPVYVLRPRTVLGFLEQDFVGSATRWRFLGENVNPVRDERKMA